jgi:hypothetical protein
MKKNTLAFAIATSCFICAPSQAAVIQGTGDGPTASTLGTTNATAFKVVEGGAGHELIVPYYTVQRGNMTVLHLVNTDVINGKVVKLRFRGAANGDNLLDFLVLLSPGDVWTGAVNADANGLAQLTTADQSCTYPRLVPGASQPFTMARLNQAWLMDQRRNNTREGYVEAIVAADVPSRSSAMFTAIKHVNGTPPCTASVLDGALLTDAATETDAAGRGFAAPTGGVAGSWYIIDVAETTTFSGAATAIRAVDSTGQNARGNYVLFPQTAEAVSAPERYTSDPLLVSAGLAGRSKDLYGTMSSPTTAAVVPAKYYDLPDLSTPYYLPAGAVNARTTAGDLTSLLDKPSLVNQYALDPSVHAKTDWVFSMPTKRYSVGIDYAQPIENARVFSSVSPHGGNKQFFYDTNTRNINAIYNSYQTCTVLHYITSSREGRAFGFSIFTGEVLKYICGATGVVAYGDLGNSALSASVGRMTLTSEIWLNGWALVNDLSGENGLGLPVLGGAFIKLSNSFAAPGISGTYGIYWPYISNLGTVGP